jgi:S1-C subfamily serine protease
MIKMVTTLALALGIATAAPSAVMKASQAAVNIMLQDKNTNNWMTICSGSFVDLPLFKGEKVIVTAGHCVDDLPNNAYSAHLFNKDDVDLELVDHMFAWPIGDYAIFRVVEKDQAALKNIKPLKVGKKLSTPGEPVYMFSGPLGTVLNYYEGYYSGKMGWVDSPTSVDEMDWVIMNAAPGSSGSVVLNAKGEAVGILVAGMDTDVKLFGALLSDLPLN